MRARVIIVVGAAALLVAALFAAPALAQAHNPFSVGISEGGGAPSGLMGWIMAQQGLFERSIAAAVRGSTHDRSALWLLMGLSFLYGILHAAGPGHGKAVLASYMMANETALRRGIVLSFLAALLQASVAIVVVALLSYVFHATQMGMRATDAVIEKASYGGVAALGLWLFWRKGRAFVAEWRAPRRAGGRVVRRSLPDLAFAGASGSGPLAGASPALSRLSFDRACADPDCAPVARGFACEEAHEHGPTCGHVHAPDPTTLGECFSWREQISTVLAAGARPCSGAILVLVFSLAQGFFVAGIASTLVMAFGTALMTATLASTAVLAKPLALRLVGRGSQNGRLVARGLEAAAALLVFAVGVSLLIGIGPLQSLA
ncbi:MAG TPA: nickel/cobalt transporter [Lichenihabitans sp.]|nr:nickel/cobalt transporter [Lichenihabitans sp.]